MASAIDEPKVVAEDPTSWGAVILSPEDDDPTVWGGVDVTAPPPREGEDPIAWGGVDLTPLAGDATAQSKTAGGSVVPVIEASPVETTQSSTAPERGVIGGIGAGLARGAFGIVSDAGGFVAGPLREMAGQQSSGLNEALGIGKIYGAIGNALRSLGDKAKGSETIAPSGSVAQGGAFNPGNWRWWTERSTEFVPQLAAQLGLAFATKSPTAFMASGGAQMAGNAYNEASDDLKKKGVSEDEARPAAALEAGIVGIVGSLIERIPGAEFLTKKGPINRALTKIIRNRVARRGVAGFASEGTEELFQEVATDLAALGFRQDSERFKDAASRYAGAFVLGGLPGAGAGVLTGGGEQKASEIASEPPPLPSASDLALAREQEQIQADIGALRSAADAAEAASAPASAAAARASADALELAAAQAAERAAAKAATPVTSPEPAPAPEPKVAELEARTAELEDELSTNEAPTQSTSAETPAPQPQPRAPAQPEASAAILPTEVPRNRVAASDAPTKTPPPIDLEYSDLPSLRKAMGEKLTALESLGVPIYRSRVDAPPPKEGYVRLFHGTYLDSLRSIKQRGVVSGDSVNPGGIKNALTHTEKVFEEKDTLGHLPQYGDVNLIMDVPVSELSSPSLRAQSEGLVVELPTLKPEWITGVSVGRTMQNQKGNSVRDVANMFWRQGQIQKAPPVAASSGGAPIASPKRTYDYTERAKDYEFEQRPATNTAPIEPTPAERNAIIAAARELQQETGFSAVPIADIMERAQIDSIERGRGIAAHLWRKGDAQVSTGDWSLSDARTRAWAFAGRQERNTHLQIESDAVLAKSAEPAQPAAMPEDTRAASKSGQPSPSGRKAGDVSRKLLEKLEQDDFTIRDAANEILNSQKAPKELKKLANDLKAAIKSDREEYGERSGLPEDAGDRLLSALESLASESQTPAKQIAIAKPANVDVSQILSAATEQEANAIGGKMMATAATNEELSAIQSALQAWKPRPEPRAPSVGAPSQTPSATAAPAPVAPKAETPVVAAKSGGFALKTQKASEPKLRSFTVKKRKSFPPSSSGRDVIDILINDVGKLKHPETARWEVLHREGKGIAKTTERGGEYDELAKLPPELLRHITEGVYRRKGEGKGRSPDSAAMEVYPNEEGVTAERLIPELLNAYNSRLRLEKNTLEQEASQKAAESKAEAQTTAFESESKVKNAGDEKLPASSLNVGDTVEVNGETMKVIDYDPDTGTVTLEDGSRYGVQEVKDGDYIYGEVIDKATDDDPDWLSLDESVDTPAKAAEVLASEKLVTNEVAPADRPAADEPDGQADGQGQAGASGVAAEGEVARAQFAPDDILIMRSSFTGDDVEVSYRGPLGDDKSVVWTGKSQMAIPTEWLRRKPGYQPPGKPEGLSDPLTARAEGRYEEYQADEAAYDKAFSEWVESVPQNKAIVFKLTNDYGRGPVTQYAAVTRDTGGAWRTTRFDETLEMPMGHEEFKTRLEAAESLQGWERIAKLPFTVKAGEYHAQRTPHLWLKEDGKEPRMVKFGGYEKGGESAQVMDLDGVFKDGEWRTVKADDLSRPSKEDGAKAKTQEDEQYRQLEESRKKPLPKLRAGKSADDLLQGENDVFNLVSETAADKAARLKREAAEQAAKDAKDAAEAKAIQDRQQLDIFAEKPKSEPPKGTAAIAQRIVNAENAFIDFAMRTGELTREHAEAALQSYRKNKAIKIDPIVGQFSFTNGGFAERDVLRRAAGLEETPTEAPKPSGLKTQADTMFAGKTTEELLALAEPYTQFGPNYNRNIATTYGQLKQSVDRGDKFIQLNADELAVRLEKWGDIKQEAAPEQPSEAPKPTPAQLEKLHTDAYSIADTIASSVAQGQPDSVREAAFDAAYRNAAGSIESNGAFNPDFMRKSAMSAAGKEASKLGTSLDQPIGDSETTGQDLLPSGEAGPVENAQASNVQQLIDDAMAKLPTNERRVMEETMAGKSDEEIAAALNLTPGSVRTTRSRARKTLMDKLAGKLDSPQTTALTKEIDSHLSPEDRAVAAKELGHPAWTSRTAKVFREAYSDWLVTGKAVSAKLAHIFRSVMQASRNGLLAITVAVSFNPTTGNSVAMPNVARTPSRAAERIVIDPVTAEVSAEPEITPPVIATPVPRKSEIAPPAVVTPERVADFGNVLVSPSVRNTADWIMQRNDHRGMAFAVADKTAGMIYLFKPDGTLSSHAPALFGKDIGDTTIGGGKVTPAGRFEATLSEDPEGDLGTTVDFYEKEETTVAIHRLYLGDPSERRPARLASPDPRGRRISYGCINVDPKLMDEVVLPLFEDGGTVYVLPETPLGRSIFEGIKKQRETLADKLIGKLDEAIDATKFDLTKFHVDPFLLKSVGQPALKAALQVIRAAIRAGKPILDAIEDGIRSLRAAVGARWNADIEAKAREFYGYLNVDQPKPPGETALPDSTGLTEDRVNLERAARGELPVPKDAPITNEETLAAGRAALAAQPNRAREIMERLRTAGPLERSISREDGSVLIAEKRRLVTARDAAGDIIADPEASPEAKAVARTEWEGLEQQIAEMDQAAQDARSVWGGFGQYWQRMLREDFSFDALQRKARKTRERPLTSAEVETIRQQAEKIATLERQAERTAQVAQDAADLTESVRVHEATIRELQGELAGRPQFGKEVFVAAQRVVDRWKAEAAEARIEMRKEMGLASAIPIPTKTIMFLAKMIRAKIGEFGLSKAEASSELLAEFGEQITPYLNAAWNKAQSLINRESIGPKAKAVAAAGMRKKGEKTAIDITARAKAEALAGEELSHRTVYELARAKINEGVHGEDAVMAAVHAELAPLYDGLTERDVRRAFSEYGKVKFPSQEATAQELAEIRTLTRLQESIDRETAGLDAMRTGFQRQKATDAVREKQRRLNELLKQRQGPPSPEALTTRDEAKQTALRNRIADIDRELRTGERQTEATPVPDSPEVETLKAERDAMLEKLREIREAANPGPTPAEQQVKALEKIRTRLSETLAGTRDPAKPKDWNPLSNAGEDIKAEIIAMQELAAQLRREARPATDPNAAREQAQIKALEAAIERYRLKTANLDISTKGKTAGPDTRRVAQLKEIRDSRRSMYQVVTRHQRYNSATARRLETQLAAVQARIAAKDFAPRVKKVAPVLTRANLDAKAAIEAAKNEVKQGEEEYRLAHRTQYEKAKERAALLLQSVRGIVLGSDIGVLTRQGLFSWARPVTAIKATATAFKAAMSPASMARWEIEVRDRVINGEPAAPIRKEAGLSVTDTVNHPEELVITRLLSRIPDFNVAGRTIKLSVIGRTLERFQTTFINAVRADLFDAAVKQGMSPEELELRANFINSSTGRGNAKYIPKWMSLIMTSPRYEASRWEMLAQPVRNIGALAQRGVKGELDRASLANLKDMAVTMALIYGLFKLAELDEYEVEWDPTSSDFLKMRKGNDVWDVSAGLAPRLRDLMRMYVAITHPSYKENIGKVLLGAGLRTVNPAIKTPIEQVSVAGQRARGDDTPTLPFSGFRSNEEREGWISLAPLIVQSATESLKEDGLGQASFTAAREFVGSSVNRYPAPSNGSSPRVFDRRD